MKNVLLSMALLISASALADIHIQSNFVSTVKKTPTQSSTREVSFEFLFNGCVFNDIDDRLATFRIENFQFTYTILDVTDTGIVLAIHWFEKNSQDEFELVRNSTLVVAWDKEAFIRFGEKNVANEVAESKSITIVARKVAHKDVAGMVSEKGATEEVVDQEFATEATEEVAA